MAMHPNVIHYRTHGDLATAFWTVFHKIFKWRPIVMGCCDCHGTYYITKNKIVRHLKDNEENDTPVIACPYCGLEHLVAFVRLDPNVVRIKWEIETDE